MSTITAILEPDADGSLHLPLRAELQHCRVRIEATLEAADRTNLATPEMLEQRREAFATLRALGGLRDVIPDPVAWQREQRKDRPLPGRSVG